jgi:hypothetical protein
MVCISFFLRGSGTLCYSGIEAIAVIETIAIIEAIETIGTLSKMIIGAIDWISTILFNPIIILTFIDKLTIVIIISLIVLKMLGFSNLEKWILLSTLIKVVSMVFI